MYALIKNNVVEKYPYSLRELRQQHPNVSFPKYPSASDLAAFDVFPITHVDVVIDQRTQIATETSPVYNEQEGRWERAFDVRNKTPEELEADESKQALTVRLQRNKMLSDSDWTQVADAVVDKAEWAAYRQELRDISTQVGFPWMVNWPMPPQ
jgi:hypothetical protein